MPLPSLAGVRKMKILLAVDDSSGYQTALKRASPQRDEALVVHVVDILTDRSPDKNAYYPGVERGVFRGYKPPPCEKCLKGSALKCFWF